MNSPSSSANNRSEKVSPMKTQASTQKNSTSESKSKKDASSQKNVQSAGIKNVASPQKLPQNSGITNFQSPGIKNVVSPQKLSQSAGIGDKNKNITSPSKNQPFYNLKGQPISQEETKNETNMQKIEHHSELPKVEHQSNNEGIPNPQQMDINEKIIQTKDKAPHEMKDVTQELANFRENGNPENGHQPEHHQQKIVDEEKHYLITESKNPEPQKMDIEKEISEKKHELSSHANENHTMTETKNLQNLATSHPNTDEVRKEEVKIDNPPNNNKKTLQKSAPFDVDKGKSPKEEEKNELSANHKRTFSENKAKPQMPPNVALYLGAKSSWWCQWDIEDLLNRKGDYNFLEGSHSFVQWLFPNHFSSAFNSSSYALTLSEAREFRSNDLIAKRLMKAYDLMFDFYGFQIKNNEIVRIDGDFKERYNETIAYPTHNHLRIRRILAHLNVVGFRELAIKVVNFLQKEVEKKDSGLGYIKRVVMETWSKYGEIDENNEEQVKSLLSNCYPYEGVFGKKMGTKEGRKELIGYLHEKSVWYTLSEEEKSNL